MIVGREIERERLATLIASAVPACIVIDGEPGIGKTALWLHTVEIARAHRRVLSARPAEGEAVLPYAALGDLLEHVQQGELNAIPVPQREALDLALQRAAARQRATQLAVSRAVLATLQELSGRQPLLIAIDDLQWLDRPTEQALEFALRRLAASSIGVLLSRRAASPLPLPLGLDRPPAGVEVTHLTMGPLTIDDVGEMLRLRLGLALPRPRLAELHRACGGNALYALEIGRALVASRAAPDSDTLPVPDDLGALLHQRMAALSSPARLAVLLTAASPQPTASAVSTAAGRADGLAEARRREIIEFGGERLRFTHPLLGSTAYSAATRHERRDAHERLARTSATRLERAHHLSLSTVGADESIAAELDAAAGEAAARGAPDAAARLMERAADLSLPAGGEQSRRRLAEAAALHVVSGDPGHARRILERLVGELPPGAERARCLVELADLTDDPAASIGLCEVALEEARADPLVAARVHDMLSTLNTLVGERERAAEHARSSVALAEEAGDEPLLAVALASLCNRLVLMGLPYAQADIDRALDLEQRHDDFPALRRPSVQYGVILGHTDRPDVARPLLQAELSRLERAGNESWQIAICFRLADIELRAGNWMAAATLARRSMSTAMHSGIEQEQAIGLMVHGLVQAHLGHLDEARDAAIQALSMFEAKGNRTYTARAQAVLGFIELSQGNAEAALVHLSPASSNLRDGRVGELSVSQVVHNQIDALVAVGELAEATRVIEFVEEMGAPTGRSWHAVVAERGRALIAAARGDVSAARRHIDRAIAAHDRLPQPFELGRTRLAQGTIERRAKNRRLAREALTAALEIFDQLGAPLWSEKAAADLARIPGRVAHSAQLSATESRVAELVAAGMSNKEVASELFVAVRTVEANLTRIYAKLRVRSRTELVAAIKGREIVGGQ